MLRSSLPPHPLSIATRLRTAAISAGIALALVPAAGAPAAAQSAVCQEGQKHLNARKDIVERINGLGKKKIDPRKACSLFGQLANNGATTIKWAETNKDWCQVPDQFVQGLKADHERVVSMRGKACQAAAQVIEMEKRARQQAQGGGGGGLWGGDGLSGSVRIPQGAL